MATDVEKLLVQMNADLRNFEREFQRAVGITNRTARSIENRFSQMDRRLNVIGRSAAAGISAAFAGAVSISAAIKLVDAAKQVENALKTTGLAGDGLRSVYDQLFASAQRNAAPLESLVQLYSRLSLNQRELNVSSADLIKFSDKVALGLRVGGTDAQAASGALLQLSQALGGGVVRAEEFNSVLEGAPTIAQAVAAGLKEAGGSVATLRKLVIDGSVSSQAFFQAFLAGSQVLETRVAGAETTVSQQFIRLQNVLVDTAGKIDDATDAGERLGGAVEILARTIQSFGSIIARTADSDLGKLLGWFDNGISKANQFITIMGGIPGVFEKMSKLNQDIFAGKPIGSTIQQDYIQSRIDGAFDVANPKSPPKTGRLPAVEPVKTVSLSDYAVPATSGSGRKTKAAGADELQREIQQTRERTNALMAAYAAQASLNPLIDDYGFAVEKAAKMQDLLTAAQRDGKTVTPEMRAQMEALADVYARAASEFDRLREAQDSMRAAVDDWAAAAKDATRGFIDDLVASKSAAEAFSGVLDKIASRLIDSALDGLFSTKGGLLGSIFGSFKLPGRATGGPVTAGQPYIVGERRPELFVPNSSGRIVPQVPTMPDMSQLRAASQGVTVTYAPQIDNRGASVEAVSRLEQAMTRQRQDLEANVISIVRKAKNSRVKGI